MEICQVEGCRFDRYHRTEHHVCGTCHILGHGQRECGNVEKITKLNEIIEKENPNDIIIIPYKHHDNTKSYLYPLVITERVKQINSDLRNKTGQYNIYDIGLGCVLFARNNKNIIEYIFVGDGEEQNPEKSTQLKIFLCGYTKCISYKPHRPVVPFPSLLS